MKTSGVFRAGTKSLLSLLVILLVVFSLPPCAFAEKACVMDDGVNVRTGPGDTYAVFASLDRGTFVTVTNRSSPDWYQITWDGKSGYVPSSYLLVQEEAAVPASAVQESVPGYVNGMYVSMRSGPGTSYAILGTYSNGKALTITGRSGDWVSVTIDGKDGFIFKDYVSEGSVSAVMFEDAGPDPYGGVPIAGAARAPSVPESPASAEGSSGTAAVSSSPGIPNTGSVREEVSNPTADETDGVTMQFGLLPSGSEPAGESAASINPNPSSADGLIPSQGQIIGNAVRMRTGPGTTYPILDTLNKGTEVEIIGKSGSWLQVMAENRSGYIHEDYIQPSGKSEAASSTTQNAVPEEDISSASASLPVSTSVSSPSSALFQPRDGYISGNGIRIRSAPSMTADILKELNNGTALRIIGREDGWVRVICNGLEGFVWSDYVSEGSYEPKASVSRTGGAALGKEIAEYALNYIGYPYKWGGSSPASGFDCSGFVAYVFGQFGYTTSRIANDVTSDGVHVDPKDMQPGDVLCFYSGNGYVGHVGIYIGDDTFVHAANSVAGVVTTPLSTGYYASRGYEVRRIIE